MTSDTQLRNRDIESLCDKLYPLAPHPSKSNSLNRKPMKSTLKRCDKDAEVQLFTTDGFWWEFGKGRTQFYLRGRPLRV